ncbi:uncharacterized protein MAL8P1.12 [Anoplophora glabripennis]|uniref:uncharacterized protein MAL8P1.12 n=1 Tax=Anoplophora glabripennis TaxID=217634 RepID=UPI0008748C50|nr:uncharacterized protein MAL8P1.12 [Anoplophora glabripennis]
MELVAKFEKTGCVGKKTDTSKEKKQWMSQFLAMLLSIPKRSDDNSLSKVYEQLLLSPQTPPMPAIAAPSYTCPIGYHGNMTSIKRREASDALKGTVMSQRYSDYDFLNDSLTYDQFRPGEYLMDEEEPERVPEKQNSLEKLNDQQLINAVNGKEIQVRHLRLENKVFTNFLQSNDPTELEGVENILSFALARILDRKEGSLGRLPMPGPDLLRASCSSARRSIRLDSFSSMSSIFEGRGPKVNLSQKSDMVLKAMEELQSKLEVFSKKAHRNKRNVKAELEEYSVREKDIKESVDSFEFNILVQGVDPLTQRIPAEKFLRWMEEWLKSAQLNIEKLRLRTASLKIQYKKVSAILLQRQELGENVHAVDFDQIEIENKHFAEKIELKNIQLVELKRMSGGASLVLTNNKKGLRKLQDTYNERKAAVAEKEKMIEETQAECRKIEAEMDEAKEKYNNFKKLTTSYKVPDVMEYVNIKRQLNDLQNKIKVWNRRKKIQDITINACLRQMKNITGSSKIDRAWLEDLTSEGTIPKKESPKTVPLYLLQTPSLRKTKKNQESKKEDFKFFMNPVSKFFQYSRRHVRFRCNHPTTTLLTADDTTPKGEADCSICNEDQCKEQDLFVLPLLLLLLLLLTLLINNNNNNSDNNNSDNNNDNNDNNDNNYNNDK